MDSEARTIREEYRHEAIYPAVDRERVHQDRKWGPPAHDVPGWLLILRRELWEAEQAWVTGSGDDDALCEILQVVAVGVAALEQHGVVERVEVHDGQ